MIIKRDILCWNKSHYFIQSWQAPSPGTSRRHDWHHSAKCSYFGKYDDTREGGYGGTYGDVVNIPHPLAIIDDNIMDRYNEM